MAGLASTSLVVSMRCHIHVVDFTFPAGWPSRMCLGEVASLKCEMWQWRAPLPSRAARSRLFDGGPEPGERVAQTFILDVGEAGGDARRRLRVERWAGSAGLAAERGLPQPQPADGLPAEEPVHPLEHDAGEQLDLERHRSLDPQQQHPGLPRLALNRSRPLDFFRLRMGRDL